MCVKTKKKLLFLKIIYDKIKKTNNWEIPYNLCNYGRNGAYLNPGEVKRSWEEPFMSVQLLDKTRKINNLLHNNNSHKVVFNDICEVLNEILESNVLVISRKGKVLGIKNRDDIVEIKELIKDVVGRHIDSLLNERLLNILSTKENVNLRTLGFEFDEVDSYKALITPIDIAGERLGTLFIYKTEEQYTIDDIILSEYGTTVVGLEMMRSVNEENAEENRKVQIVRSAINTLSFSELEAITHIFEELKGTEGILVASKIADRVGITRSVIVNALRKFESAGVIESRSSGMKGTYIKVLNDVVFDELKNLKNKN
jgi:transcriptional pleiotropic repressor